MRPSAALAAVRVASTRSGAVKVTSSKPIFQGFNGPRNFESLVRKTATISTKDVPLTGWRQGDLEHSFKKLSDEVETDASKLDQLLAIRDELAKRLRTNRLIEAKKALRSGQVAMTKSDATNHLWLRDACNCSLCVDPSTKQKTFQTTEIPSDIKIDSEKRLPDGSLQITWANDIPGNNTGPEKRHVSTYSKQFLESYSRPRASVESLRNQSPRVLWNQATISKDVTFFDYDKYMSDNTVLYNALEQLRIYGLTFIRGVPDDEKGVEAIGGRIGTLRDTFYGRTWNVKSVPDAKNVAYTNVNLGFHMDLLYMAEPPGLQLLHCLRNSCEGGSSLFSDAFFAASRVSHPGHLKTLDTASVTFHYDNDGQHYRRSRPIIKRTAGSVDSPKVVKEVNWSPPFQAPFVLRKGISDSESLSTFQQTVNAMKALASHIEDPDNIYEYRLQEGECVIFNNRRVLHARRAFDVASGERWLKGAYVDTDVFRSRLRVLHETTEGSQALMPSAGLT